MMIVRNRLLAAIVLALSLFTGLVGGTLAQDATPAASPVASPIAAGTVEVTGLVAHPTTLSVADLQALTSQTVEVDFESGKGSQHHAFTGVLLSDVLNQAGVLTNDEIKSDILRFYAVITGNDGYQVVISLGEIDPQFGNSPYLLAWEEDGAALEADSGPLRLVPVGDVRGGRYVSGITSIDVQRIP
jgi:DMSO/TMAO reductase YedYZ molybdopterin-dependent catalytic subunit